MAQEGRRSSYPVQSTEFTPHPELGPEHVEKKQEKLPATIRALQNSSDLKAEHPRTIVICLDGTGDQYDGDNSNVVNFVSCLKKHWHAEQVTYYQSGIGTYDKGGLKNGIGSAMDMAVGSGLGIHIKDAYRFLMQNYHDGDKICLLGFSRGAYTVRCLAGMLHKVGLLPAGNGSQINFAYDFYKDDSQNGWNMSRGFKKTFCTDVNVYFVGVWDCVASVGFIPRKLPFGKSPTNRVRYFRHAMALDEHRAKFKVCQWQHQDPDEAPGPGGLKRRATIDNTPMGKFRRSRFFNCFGSKEPKIADRKGTTNGTTNSASNGMTDGAAKHHGIDAIKFHGKDIDSEDEMEQRFEAQEAAVQRHKTVKSDALEVWFMGAHADVGGGAVANEERHMLSRIPLRWMIRQCFECNTGILFSTAALAELGLDVESLWPVYKRPSKPTIGPPPALLEKKERGILAPLERRSTFLPIDVEEGENIKDAPTADDLQYILPSESTEDHFDATARVNDQLKDAKSWWILEFWPVKVRVLAKDGEGWEKKVRVNLGRHRAIRESEPKMHWTVGHMVETGKYTLRTRCDKTTTWQEVA